MKWRNPALQMSMSFTLATILLTGCGANASDPPAPVAQRLCPQTLDYNTVFTGGSGSGELIQVQLDTNAMTYKITYLASAVPSVPGAIQPTRALAPNNTFSGALTQETLLPTAPLNQCAFVLNHASLNPAHPARFFLGDGVLGGAIPGAQIAFAGVAGVGVVPDTTFPYYPFISFSQQSTDLADIAGTYTRLGYHKVPSKNFLPVAVDSTLTIQADGSFNECHHSGIHAGQCLPSNTAFIARNDSPTFESAHFLGQTRPTQAPNGPQATGILIVGKLHNERVPILIRVGAADPSIEAPVGAPPKTPLADDESGISLLAPLLEVTPGSKNGEYIGIDSNFNYRTAALIGTGAALIDPFNPSQATLARAFELDYTQTIAGMVMVRPAGAAPHTPTTRKMIFTGGTFGYLDVSEPSEPYFMVGAFVQ